MSLYSVLPRIKLVEIYEYLNRENVSDNRGVALREIDVSSLERLRERTVQNGKKVAYSAYIAKAAAIALREFPRANRAYMGFPFMKRLVQFYENHISIAVERADAATEHGYEAAFIYSIYNTDKKSIPEIASEIAGLATVKNDGKSEGLERWERMQSLVNAWPVWILKIVGWLHKNIPSQYLHNRGGNLVISSPAKYGVDFIVASWAYTLGMSFGLVKERPWVENGDLCVRRTTTLTFSFDRRIVSGSLAARMLNRICEILENADEVPELG